MIDAFPVRGKPDIIFFILQEAGNGSFRISFFGFKIFQPGIYFFCDMPVFKTYPKLVGIVFENGGDGIFYAGRWKIYFIKVNADLLKVIL